MKKSRKKIPKINKKEKIPETELEKEVKEKAEIIPQNKKDTVQDDFIDELDANGIISSREFNQILKSEIKLNQLENIPVRSSLEGGLIFAPRIKDKQSTEGKVYSDAKYDKKYNEPRYSEKTPGNYAEKTESPGKESSKGSDNAGRGNQ
jgi:hypothetical protein